MAEFKSRYAELGFYVDGNFRKFKNGRYITEDKREIEVLEGLIDAERVDAENASAPKKAEPQTESNTEDKAPAATSTTANKRKSSAK